MEITFIVHLSSTTTYLHLLLFWQRIIILLLSLLWHFIQPSYLTLYCAKVPKWHGHWTRGTCSKKRIVHVVNFENWNRSVKIASRTVRTVVFVAYLSTWKWLQNVTSQYAWTEILVWPNSLQICRHFFFQETLRRHFGTCVRKIVD